VCGRYAATKDAETIAGFFHAEELPLVTPRSPRIPDYNVTPTSEVFVVLEQDGTRRVDVACWGLIPSWSKDASRASRMINARSETVAAKPAYRSAFRKRRCLVPADGYYEWQARAHSSKQPFFIHDEQSKPLAFAGLYEDWDGPDGAVRSCTICTMDARGPLAPIHDRMPVVVSQGQWDEWLNPGTQDPDQLLQRLVDQADASTLVAYPVSTQVNKPANNGPQLLEAVPGPVPGDPSASARP
jgi:putative SOS response-associated peptidase YedK